MRLAPLALLVLVGLVTPSTAMAQVPAEPGSISIAASLFTDDDGSVLGVWYLLGSRLNLGLEVELNRATSEETVTSPSTKNDGLAETESWTVGPAVKWYGRVDGPVIPYLRAKVAYGESANELQLRGEIDSEGSSSTFLVSGALGAEWFPIPQLSVGAHAGLFWQRREVDTRNSQVRRDRTDTNWATFRSGIELFYYFR